MGGRGKTQFISTHADRQGVDISVTVYVFVFCTLTDFSAEDKDRGVKFCTAVPAGNLTFWGTLLPQKPKIRRIGQRAGHRHDVHKNYPVAAEHMIARRVDVGSACVDIRPSPRTDVLVRIFIA